MPRIDSLKPSAGLQARLRQQVAGEVLRDELVVGHVGVEGADDVIAVLVGVGDGGVELVAARLGVAHQVEPVPAPALAEVRRGQQPVHHLLVGVGDVVVEEGVDFVGRRRQADQVEGDAPQQRALVGGGRGRQLLLFELGEDEASTGPRGQALSLTAGGAGGRSGCQAQWSCLRFWQVEGGLVADGRVGAVRAARGAHLDPGGQVGDDGVGQLPSLAASAGRRSCKQPPR